MSAIDKRFGKALKELRRKKHVTQVVMAEYCDKSQAWVSLVEKGERSVDMVDIHAIAAALHVMPATIINLGRKR